MIGIKSSLKLCFEKKYRMQAGLQLHRPRLAPSRLKSWRSLIPPCLLLRRSEGLAPCHRSCKRVLAKALCALGLQYTSPNGMRSAWLLGSCRDGCHPPALPADAQDPNSSPSSSPNGAAPQPSESAAPQQAAAPVPAPDSSAPQPASRAGNTGAARGKQAEERDLFIPIMVAVRDRAAC